VCVSAPDEAVTAIVYVPAGVPGLLGGFDATPPPPHPAASTTIASSPPTGTSFAIRGVRPARCQQSNPRNDATKQSVHSQLGGIFRIDGICAPRAVVVIVSVVLELLPLGVIVGGENDPDAREGSPEALNVIGFGKPPAAGAAEIVKLADWPAVIVTGLAGPLGVKSTALPVSVTVCVVEGSLSVIVKTPERAPAVVGVKITVTVQFVFGATEVQLFV
jgi:hypothetical protein